MNLKDALEQFDTIFLDTAPIIYYIEAHPQYGALAKTVVDSFQSGKTIAFTSVLTLTEVLSKPVQRGDEKLTLKFANFLQYGKNLKLIEISSSIAIRAGRLRGQYSDLRTIDSIQISAALEVGASAFLTNDKKLKNIRETKILLLTEYL